MNIIKEQTRLRQLLFNTSSEQEKNAYYLATKYLVAYANERNHHKDYVRGVEMFNWYLRSLLDSNTFASNLVLEDLQEQFEALQSDEDEDVENEEEKAEEVDSKEN